ncbi:MAG: DUF5675 family protein [Gemmataceae bacterium]|nr:DUF5675 family protein [Gemmataceae bacterium]
MKWISSVVLMASTFFLFGFPVGPCSSGPPKPPAVTGKWIGVFTQPDGPLSKLFPMQLDLEYDKGDKGKVRGKLRIEMVDQPKYYHVLAIEGVQNGNLVQLKDTRVIETTQLPGGFRWFTNRVFHLKPARYQTLVGAWSDPTNPLLGTGEIALTRFDFHVVIQRKETTADGLVKGELSVNGIKLGPVYENAKKLIPPGSYPGVRRYKSTKRFVQGPGGRLAQTGDFLLEIGKVPDRTDILIHPGNKAEHSEGCVLAGGAPTRGGITYAPKSLQEMRLYFYGTDKANPRDPWYVEKEKAIRIEIKDMPRAAQEKASPLREAIPGAKQPEKKPVPPQEKRSPRAAGLN